MSLIDKTYFVHEINIPDSDYSDLTAYISRYEKEILRELLGYELWKLVAAYDAGTSPQRIIDLVDGKEYDVDGKTIKWNGLKNADKISLIAYYVYYRYVKNRSRMNTVLGVVKPRVENATQADPLMTLVESWSRLRELYGYAGQYALIPSAYNFLMEHEADYPEWEFTDIGTVNSFDL